MRAAPTRKRWRPWRKNTVLVAWCGVHPLPQITGNLILAPAGVVVAVAEDGTVDIGSGYTCSGLPGMDEFRPCLAIQELE